MNSLKMGYEKKYKHNHAVGSYHITKLYFVLQQACTSRGQSWEQSVPTLL